jgi:hypothetical protein
MNEYEERAILDEIDEISLKIIDKLYLLFEPMKKDLCYLAMTKSLVLLGKILLFDDDEQIESFKAWIDTYEHLDLPKN